MTWFMYILQCGNGDLYTGVTSDLDRRLAEHQSRKGGWYTKSVQPVRLVYHESFDSEGLARRREHQVKDWSRKKKLALIAGNTEALNRV